MNWRPREDDDDDDDCDLPYNYKLNDSEDIELFKNPVESVLDELSVEPAHAIQFSLTDDKINEVPHTSSDRTDFLLEHQRGFQSVASLSNVQTNRVSDTEDDSDIIQNQNKPIFVNKKYFKFKKSNIDSENLNASMSDSEEISDGVEDDFSTLFGSDSDVPDVVFEEQKLRDEQVKLNAKFYRGLSESNSRRRDDYDEPTNSQKSFSVKLQFKLD